MSNVGGYHGQTALMSGRDGGLPYSASPFAASYLSLIIELFPELTKFCEKFQKLKTQLAEKHVRRLRPVV